MQRNGQTPRNIRILSVRILQGTLPGEGHRANFAHFRHEQHERMSPILVLSLVYRGIYLLMKYLLTRYRRKGELYIVLYS